MTTYLLKKDVEKIRLQVLGQSQCMFHESVMHIK